MFSSYKSVVNASVIGHRGDSFGLGLLWILGALRSAACARAPTVRDFGAQDLRPLQPSQVPLLGLLQSVSGSGCPAGCPPAGPWSDPGFTHAATVAIAREIAVGLDRRSLSRRLVLAPEPCAHATFGAD